MVVSHSRKKGVRYRYYVSQAILQSRKDEAGEVFRVAAAAFTLPSSPTGECATGLVRPLFLALFALDFGIFVLRSGAAPAARPVAPLGLCRGALATPQPQHCHRNAPFAAHVQHCPMSQCEMAIPEMLRFLFRATDKVKLWERLFQKSGSA